jgi:hypothetical protein
MALTWCGVYLRSAHVLYTKAWCFTRPGTLFEPGNTVETALGVGEVTKDDYDALTCRLSLNVRY